MAAWVCFTFHSYVLPDSLQLFENLICNKKKKRKKKNIWSHRPLEHTVQHLPTKSSSRILKHVYFIESFFPNEQPQTLERISISFSPSQLSTLGLGMDGWMVGWMDGWNQFPHPGRNGTKAKRYLSRALNWTIYQNVGGTEQDQMITWSVHINHVHSTAQLLNLSFLVSLWER